MKLNVITGLPRAGSTLLCNILNQNPKFWATSTSPLAGIINGMVHNISNAVEIKSLLNTKKVETEQRIKNSILAFVESWHEQKSREVIFDKSRAWSLNSLAFKKLYPDSKIIVMVRDLRNVFASIEKQHQKNPLLDDAQNAIQKTVFDRANRMFGDQGLIGGPILGIEDLIRRKPPGVIYVQYESMAANPSEVFEKIYTELNETLFEHNFENIENTAEDPDGFYLNKYPHIGAGKVEASDPNEWRQYFSPDLANTIMNRFQNYNRFFGYI